MRVARLSAALLFVAACHVDEGPPPVATFACSNGGVLETVHPCTACIDEACPTESGACFGENWSSAQFSGVCMPLIDCLCACAPATCVDECERAAPPECATCLETLQRCQSGSCAGECRGFPIFPVGSGSGGSSSGGSGGSGFGGSAFGGSGGANAGSGGTGASGGLGGMAGASIGGFGGTGFGGAGGIGATGGSNLGGGGFGGTGFGGGNMNCNQPGATCAGNSDCCSSVCGGGVCL